MPFDWLNQFQQKYQKSDSYAGKTLAAYRLGMKAGGAIRGVRVQVDESCCEAAQSIARDAIYSPEDAPRLPLPDCPLGQRCRCLYRPVMDYEAFE